MFKRYPYKGWLLLALVCWGLAITRYYTTGLSVKPDRMARTVEQDLHKKQKSFAQLLEDDALTERIFFGNITERDITRLTEQAYGIYAYRNDTIVFWSTNKILADCEPPRPDGVSELYHHERGKFVKTCVTPDTNHKAWKLVVLYPVVTLYPFENSYLHSSFIAADYIPMNTAVLSRPSKHCYEISTISGQKVFYLDFDKSTLPVWTPGWVMITLLVLAVAFSIFWFQLITTYLVRTRSYWTGFFLLGGVILAFRVITYRFGLPFNMETLPIFRSQLYATSVLLDSLGQLLINTLLFLWLVLFVVRHGNLQFLRQRTLSPMVKLVVGVAIILTLYIYCFAYINIVSSLITDSTISFDVSHFYSISTYTIIGLFIVALITTASFVMVYLLSEQLTIVLPVKWMKYLTLVVIGVVMIVLSDTVAPASVSYAMLLWMIIFVMLLDVPRLRPASDLFSPQMIFWSAFIVAFCTGVLQYFNYVKEHEARIHFAEKVVQQRDNITEFTFKAIQEDIAEDPLVISYLKSSSKTVRREIDERFDALYLGGHLNKYQCKLLMFDRHGRSLYNGDTTSYNTMVRKVKEAAPTFTPSLYYREDAADGHYYVAEIPVHDGDTSYSGRVGYVFIDMAVKESAGQTVYPELLQPGIAEGNSNADGYSYGVYVDDKLLTQTSDINFPIYLTDSIKGDYKFTEYPNSSELQLRTESGKRVFVIRFHRLWLESITLFSYLFGIQMILAFISILYRIYLLFTLRSEPAQKLINFTLRRRIHISFLGIVFVSFIIIGIVTILFFSLQYRQNSRKKQQLVMQLVERATIQYLQENKGFNNVAEFNHLVTSTSFKYFITSLSNAQKIDVNLYHASGVLSVTSQEDIYDRSLYARIISPEAYYMLSQRAQTFLIESERIGKLSYTSCYKPITNRNGVTLGYINVPFFSSEKELNFQISSILVGLINLYAFIFLFSGVLTVFITRWITKSLSVVISSFSKFSLSKNEPVSWPYDDEIGLLVKEYNKMVKKAEENARLLAQNEREGAWREMAQQVAHEIKNPLTPMKLNIQYLQQALNNNYPNVNDLAKKVSDSLIEQIENLSYIASEFSNFAKMPEARPETFDLNDLLQKTVDLYENQSEVKVSFTPYIQPLAVYTDKSQLLRVCNNLLENAVQAIPAEREGRVNVIVSKEGDEALIAFADNGTGIKPDAVSRIFQPYFTTKSSGTGLGLAMTKKIIEFWKGTIRFETTPGKGTTFYITIPMANGQED